MNHQKGQSLMELCLFMPLVLLCLSLMIQVRKKNTHAFENHKNNFYLKFKSKRSFL